MGMDISVLGVDLGKNICSVVGLDGSGSTCKRFVDQQTDWSVNRRL
jgi:hypothetical protein